MRRSFLCLLAATLCACGAADVNERQDAVSLGVLPDQSAEQLRRRYTPLVDYLEASTSLDIELVVPADYPSMLDAFAAGELDIVNFGGLTFTQAESRSNAAPLVMRDVDLNFRSCYIACGEDTRQNVAEFGADSFSFGPRLSTSGHLMPRHFLARADVDPDTFFESVQYSSGHDQTVEWVRDKVVALGVVNCVILQSMLADERIEEGQIRILAFTPAYANYVWAVQETMDKSVRRQLRDAFLGLDPMDPAHGELLQTLGAKGYLPASTEDFNDVRLAVTYANTRGTPD